MTYIIILKVIKVCEDQLNRFEIFSKTFRGHPPVQIELRMFEYMLQSRESSWGIPIHFIDNSEFITGQCKKILSRANKTEIKCFEFGSIKRALRPHLRTIMAG